MTDLQSLPENIACPVCGENAIKGEFKGRTALICPQCETPTVVLM